MAQHIEEPKVLISFMMGAHQQIKTDHTCAPTGDETAKQLHNYAGVAEDWPM